MGLAQFHIDAGPGPITRIWLDGVEVVTARALTLELDANDAAKLTIVHNCYQGFVQGQAEVVHLCGLVELEVELSTAEDNPGENPGSSAQPD